MISILFTILKILGIFLLTVLGILLVLVVLILFVPVRYRISAYRRMAEEIPMAAEVKVTWLLYILNAAFSYPEAAYVRVRVFCFTVFCTDRADTDKQSKPSQKSKNEQKDNDGNTEDIQSIREEENCDAHATEPMENSGMEQDKAPENSKEHDEHIDEEHPEEEHSKEKEIVEDDFEEEPKATLLDFLKRIWNALKNIKYTITKICDKIKHIIKNIRYYIKIIKSNTFHRAWAVCREQVFSLLKSILPKKLKGNFLIGTGDPASTGQVLSVYGILYPLLGNHINITPDFEQQVLEGELFIKGKITLFKAVKTAGIIYFNKDFRRLIKLFKREAA